MPLPSANLQDIEGHHALFGHAKAVVLPGGLAESHLLNEIGTFPAQNGHDVLSIDDRMTCSNGRLRFAHSHGAGYSIFDDPLMRGHAAGCLLQS